MDDTKPVYSNSSEDFSYIAKSVPCQDACPASTDIPGYIRALFEKRVDSSYLINRRSNILPGVLGRICSRPCESACRHGEAGLGEPVNICHIKRSGADLYDDSKKLSTVEFIPNGRSVAVVGSGPSGLAASTELALAGFKVTVFEELETAGGMLRYGIPQFRLPHDVLKGEVDYIKSLGVTFKCGCKVETDPSIDALLGNFDYTLLAAGCMNPITLGIPGEELKGVISGLDFMLETASGRAPRPGKRVLVVGSGFTAFDCARTALRTGGEEVSICMRLTEQDLAVTRDEIMAAKYEGVEFQGLLVSKRIVGKESVEGVEFLRSRIGKKSAGKRREFSLIEGSEFIIPADTVIIATGQRPRPMNAPAKKDERGLFTVEPGTSRTSINTLYLAGDFGRGPSTVIQAIASGRKAADEIIRDNPDLPVKERVVRMEAAETTDRRRVWDFIPREEMPMIDSCRKRTSSMGVEVETGLTPECAIEESKRCYLCNLHYEIDIGRCIYCRYCIDVAPRDCIKMVESVETRDDGSISKYVETKNWSRVNAIMIDNTRCIRCGECMRVCPVDCISVTKVELLERSVKGGAIFEG